MKKHIAIVITLAMVLTAVTPVSAAGWTQMQTQANQIANLARGMGLAESNPIIQEASRIWWEEQARVEEEKRQEEAQFLADYHNEAVMIAKVMYCEARGISSKKELSMIAWTILNRYDAGFASSISGVITAKNQFSYRKSAPTLNDHGLDLLALAEDVLLRWHRENLGETDVGRTLPKGYCYYKGNGKHNRFQQTNNGVGYTDFGINPYES